MINWWILGITMAGIAVFTCLAWVFASWQERRRTERFNAEQAAIEKKLLQERLAAKRADRPTITPGSRADLWNTYEEKRYEDGQGDQ